MYLEIDEGFPGHRKTLRLCAALKNPEAAWYVIRLWTWACRSCPTGDLSGMDPYDIEIAVQYRPLDGACYAAMVAAGFIDESDGRPVAIHNWMKRTGASIAKMADAAKRKKAYRAHRDGQCGNACGWCSGLSEDSPLDKPRTVHATSTGQTDTDQTSPDQSRPDQTKISRPAPVRDPGGTERQQTSHGTSGEPDDDARTSSLSGNDPREGQAGDPPAGGSDNRASASPPSVALRLTVETLVATWGRAREEEFGGLAWASGHGVKSEKLRDVVDALRPHPEAIAQLDSDMRRFWRSVRHGDHDKAAEIARSNSFAFGCWWSEFGAGLGPIPEIAAPARTASARAGPRQAPHEVTRAAALRFLEREAAKDTAT